MVCAEVIFCNLAEAILRHAFFVCVHYWLFTVDCYCFYLVVWLQFSNASFSHIRSPLEANDRIMQDLKDYSVATPWDFKNRIL